MRKGEPQPSQKPRLTRGEERKITWAALGEGEDATRHGNPRRHRQRRCAPAALAVAMQGPIRPTHKLECDRTTRGASALDSVEAPRPPCSERSCDVAVRDIPCQCRPLAIASPWPNSTMVLFCGLNGMRDVRAIAWQPAGRCFWWWDQAVWARMPSFARRIRILRRMALSFRAAGSRHRMIGARITFP